MKAMVLENFGEPLVMKELPLPKPSEGEALVRVLNCGVCGTDVKIQKGLIGAPIIRLPHILGHESVGEVEALGDGVEDLEIGQRVIVHFYISCGRCRACLSGRENLCKALRRCGFELDGGFAQYQKVPASHLLPVGGIPPHLAALIPDAVATSYHAVKTMAQVKVGDRVLVVGAGGLGLHAIQIAREAGAEVILGFRSESKLQKARELVPELLLLDTKAADPLKQLMEMTSGEGVDSVIEIVGSPETLAWSLKALRKGGRLVIVGYSPGRPWAVDTMAMHYNEWEIVGSRVATRKEYQDCIRLIQKGRIKPVVDSTFPLEEVNQALERVARGEVIGRAVLDVG